MISSNTVNDNSNNNNNAALQPQESIDDVMQRCGLCSLISRLIRRAMCVGSRRGSGESYYQELAETAAPEIATMGTTDSSLCLHTIPHTTSIRKIDSDTDRPLLEALMSKEDNSASLKKRHHACNGRFLTMHKRRRKKLTTRSLSYDTAILDDILHGQVQCILKQVGNWRFNAFTLENVTGGRSLPVLCVHLFHWYGLLDYFNLDVVRVWKLFSLIEEGYHSTNPYHNSIHATDVTQAMHCFLQESKILEHLKPLEILASLIGAVTHDLDHPGVNQPFLIATSNHLAALYENTSVLENHHWRSAIGCLLESGVAEQVQNIRPELEEQISSLILATDITRQQEFICNFRHYLDNNKLDMRQIQYRHFILQIALKCADISNPCRPWDISKKWSQKVCEEFFRQGDYERQLNLPVTSLCDRFTTSVPKIQVGFFKFVVTPLFNEWHRFLKTDLSYRMMRYLKYNQNQWETRVAAELAEETKTEISDAEVADEEDIEDVDEEEEEENILDMSDSAEVLLPQVKIPRRNSLQIPSFRFTRADRRHSMPVNTPRIILPPRESSNQPAIEEIYESRYENDAFSLLSSDSDSGPRARSSRSDSARDKERPLSAETLVPDLSIATMTDSVCANRLNLVMHGAGGSMTNTTNLLLAASTSKQLIRQQTFPPLQPYIRTRYLSTTVELGGCAETVPESHSSSSASSSSDFRIDHEQREILVNKKETLKREKEDRAVQEKSCKMAKLSILPGGQKENLDPTMTKRTLNRRRGSAPVASPAVQSKSLNDTLTIYSGSTSNKNTRRGSMPVDIAKSSSSDAESQLSEIHTKTNVNSASNNTTTSLQANNQRRSSVPCDVTSRSSLNGKSRNNRKKILRRRSSGGAEIFGVTIHEPAELTGCVATTSWCKFKRELSRRSEGEYAITRRRGSLPVEVLSVCHTGTLRH